MDHSIHSGISIASALVHQNQPAASTQHHKQALHEISVPVTD